MPLTDEEMTVLRVISAEHIPAQGDLDNPGRREFIDMLGLTECAEKLRNHPPAARKRTKAASKVRKTPDVRRNHKL